MGRHLRFSLGELLLIVSLLGILIGANIRSYDISHPSGPPMEGRGFPIMWAADDAPLETSDRLIGDYNRDRFVFNCALCVGLSILPVFAVRRFPGWIRDSLAPKSNPGKLLLYFSGACCLLIAVVNGFVARGPIQIGTCVAIFLFGAIALRLAWSPFDQSNRLVTILWATSAVVILLIACLVIDPPSTPLTGRDVPGAIIVLLALIGALTLAGLAYRKAPVTTNKSVNRSGEIAQV